VGGVPERRYGSQHMKILRSLYVYWAVVFAALTVVIACLFDPELSESILPFGLDGGRFAAMLTSLPFLVCLIPTVAGIALARREWASAGDVPLTDKMIAIWFLMNATWYHIGCDAFSGLFQVMPGLTDAYITMNPNHLEPMHHPARVGLDAVYWFELLVQMPLCYLAYWLYLKRAPSRHMVLAFVCGLHITGTVAYYAPNFLLGHTFHPLMSNLDRVIGALWIIIPATLTWRAIGELQKEQGGALPVPVD